MWAAWTSLYAITPAPLRPRGTLASRRSRRTPASRRPRREPASQWPKGNRPCGGPKENWPDSPPSKYPSYWSCMNNVCNCTLSSFRPCRHLETRWSTVRLYMSRYSTAARQLRIPTATLGTDLPFLQVCAASRCTWSSFSPPNHCSSQKIVLRPYRRDVLATQDGALASVSTMNIIIGHSWITCI